MERKPWPIVLLALFNFLAPFWHLARAYLHADTTILNYFHNILHPDNFLQTAHVIFPSFLAAFAIYHVKKWSYPLFIFALCWIIGRNLFLFSIEQTLPLWEFLFATVVNFALVTYFLLPAVRIAYLNPRLRWWESKIRFNVNLPLAIIFQAREIESVVSNISEGGVFCKTPEVFPLQEQVSLAFRDQGFNFELTGKVVFKRQDQSGYGIEFVSLRPLDRKNLKKYTKILERAKTPNSRPRAIWTEDFLNWLSRLIKSGKGIFPEVRK